jgi:hypothetical protein
MPFAFTCPHCAVGYSIKDELAGSRAKCQKCGKVMDLKAPAPETTGGGSQVYRHQAQERGLEWSHGDGDLIEAVEGHISRHLGEVETVYHEVISDIVHVDVHIVPTNRDRKWVTLITSGMSERPMRPPEGVENFDYAELMLCLPATWPLSDAALKDENNYWPIGGLKYLARLPHEYETWLAPGHTVPNGDPPAPFASGTKLCCFLVTEPIGVPTEFARLTLQDGRSINFLSVIPLYREEMDLKLSKGSDALYERLDLPVEEFFNPQRKNLAKKRFGLF